ncbi:hypothetical protein EJ06DRAFT_525780 [Trichodelitschia bisporula]|uniref:Transcription factor IIA, alpha/beta subunit n=1 Tax=Trichodelitschia bisporula TaxID=703511 RepID=A0A6G1IAF5_9PEZI|nr:hypothetical protein EJ06DRAFT_525780 [Trichodelitschia bisporula]
MSNTAVGAIYAQIIDKVMQLSQNDFEEAGVDQQTLHEIKQRWQENITRLHVAQCPWDPLPPPQPQMTSTPTVPSNVPAKSEPGMNSMPIMQTMQQSRMNTEPRIKEEAKYENGAQLPQMSGYRQQFAATEAQQRATTLLQQQFGNQANASIHNTGLAQPPRAGLQFPQHRPQHQQIQLPGQGQQRPPQQSYASQQQQQQQQQKPGANQTDGAGDDDTQWAAVMAARPSNDARISADNILRAQLDASVAVIDSGLMQPRSELRKKRKTVHRQMATLQISAGAAQTDGPDDEFKAPVDQDDEDAINSDLDDTDEDELNDSREDAEDGPVGETVLCVYDKVQRVKNKWKCVLKDGILTTGNKEYVFHKAQGEFEW